MLNNRLRERVKNSLSVFFRKLRTFIFLIVPSAIMVPFVLIIRALRPFVLIRFGVLTSERIGHFAMDTAIYLCMKETGLYGQKTIDLFYYNAGYSYNKAWRICNRQLGKMWKRTLNIFPLTRFLYLANRWLPGGEDHVVRMKHAIGYFHPIIVSAPPRLSFTPQEERLGYRGLRDMAIKDNVSFVCFSARDSEYLKVAFPNGNHHYHGFRNDDINTYLPAAEELTRRGYYAIRMGAIVKDALKTSNPKIIDYAKNSRTDLLDIFICAKCLFFISPSVGVASIPQIFRRPTVFVNFTSIQYARFQDPNSLFIPKKLWLRNEDRFLTFPEILKSKIGRFTRSEQYRELGIDIVDNTPEEITALVTEMDDRIKGTWKTTEEDRELYKRFNSIFKVRMSGVNLGARIGTEFLRQNQNLLK